MNLPPNYTLIAHDSIDSTNLEAKRLIQAGQMQEGALVITAKSQTGGKGRLGRNWISEEGNLFVSVVMKLVDGGSWMGSSNDTPSTNHQPLSIQYPFLTAIAIGKTLSHFINTKLLYKWPNDVLVEGKKISGVLIETINGYVIIGIGINIASYPKDGTKLPATCLNEYSEKKVRIDKVLELLIYNLNKSIMLDDANVIKEWTESAYGIGKKISVEQGGNVVSGVFTGIDVNGRLILETQRGIRELVSFGDVRF